MSDVNPLKRIPKLWRDYSGIMPSKEMAEEAFQEMGASKNMDKGVKMLWLVLRN